MHWGDIITRLSLAAIICWWYSRREQRVMRNSLIKRCIIKIHFWTRKISHAKPTRRSAIDSAIRFIDSFYIKHAKLLIVNVPPYKETSLILKIPSVLNSNRCSNNSCSLKISRKLQSVSACSKKQWIVTFFTRLWRNCRSSRISCYLNKTKRVQILWKVCKHSLTLWTSAKKHGSLLLDQWRLTTKRSWYPTSIWTFRVYQALQVSFVVLWTLKWMSHGSHERIHLVGSNTILLKLRCKFRIQSSAWRVNNCSDAVYFHW
jgi:hypothetical protein